MGNEESIFNEALERAPQKRSEFLQQRCGGDDALRRAVEELLAGHAQVSGILESPTGVARDTIAASLSAEQVGSTIGRYKLLEQIGHGGMGVVYMAEQSHPIKRRVALKIIKPGMDSAQVIARFEAERQAL